MSGADFLQKLFFELSVALVGCACRVFTHGQKNIAELVFCNFGCSGHNLFKLFVFDEADCNFHKVADDAFHVASDIADFGKFCGFDFDERGFDHFCKTSCDFRFTDARRSFHNDVFGRDFLSHFLGEFASSISVAKSDCNGDFCVVLTDDVSVKLRNYLFRG